MLFRSSVSPNGGQFDENKIVSFTVTPSQNYVFKNWSGSDTSSDNPLLLLVNSNKTLTVNFEKKDTDGDGVTDDIDQCPDTPNGEQVNETGCSSAQVDTDGDGVTDGLDQCPDTQSGQQVNETGCSSSQVDTDGDGLADSVDQDNSTREGVPVDENGVMLNPIYLDENGITIKSKEWGIDGDVGIINGEEYLIVGENTLRSIVNSGQDISNLCTSLVLDMNGLFHDDLIGTRTVNGSISSWDVSNVVNMNQMFEKTSFDGDISGWDVSGVTYMLEMFRDSEFNQDISGWDVSSVMDMSLMFVGSQFNGDISGWDVSSVTDMSFMFTDSPFNGDISGWDVSSVTKMNQIGRAHV